MSMELGIESQGVLERLEVKSFHMGRSLTGSNQRAQLYAVRNQ